MAFTSLCVANLMCALDATSLGVSLPAITSALNGTSPKAVWTSTSFLLASTVAQPMYTALSQICGRKPLFITALAFFMLGSIVCALAPTFPVLLAGRSIQGVGGGGTLSLIYVTVTDLVPLQNRGRWFGAVSMTNALGTVAGPLIGGAFATPKLWRWLFWIHVPLSATAGFSIIFCLKLDKVPRNRRRSFASVDWIGSILFVASLASIFMSLSWGGTVYSWRQWQIILPLATGLFGFGIFVFWSAQSCKEPILPKGLFKSPTALVSFLGSIVHGMVLWSWIYYMPLYFEAVKGFSPLMAGIAQFVVTLTYGSLSALAGFMISRKETYRWAVELGWIALVIGVSHIPEFDQGTPAGSWIPKGILVGVGLGTLSPAINVATQASVSEDDLPYAAGVFVFFRTFGQLLGMVIDGTVFQNALRSQLSTRPLLISSASLDSQNAFAMVQMLEREPPSEAKDELVRAFSGSLRMVWIAVIASAVVAATVAFAFTSDYPLRRTRQNRCTTKPPTLPNLRSVSPMPTAFDDLLPKTTWAKVEDRLALEGTWTEMDKQVGRV